MQMHGEVGLAIGRRWPVWTKRTGMAAELVAHREDFSCRQGPLASDPEVVLGLRDEGPVATGVREDVVSVHGAIITFPPGGHRG